MGGRKRLDTATINRRIEIENSWTTMKYDFKGEECLDKLADWANKIKGRKKKCQCCGSVAKELQAHHLIYKSFVPKLSLNLNNGMRLCLLCHDQVHGKRLSHYPKFHKTIKADLSRMTYANGEKRNVFITDTLG